MIVYGNAAARFSGVSRYAAFAGIAEIFPGGPSFIGGADEGIFTGVDRWFLDSAAQYGYYYTALPSSTISNVGKKWAALKASDNPENQTFLSTMQIRLGDLLTAFFNAVGNRTIFGYTQPAQKKVVDVANDLKQAVQEIDQYQMKPELSILKAQMQAIQAAKDEAARQKAELEAAQRAQAAATAAAAAGDVAGAAAAAKAAADAAYRATHPPPPVSEKSLLVLDEKKTPGWIFPAAIGGGVLVVVGLILALTKKKKPAMSGYRRKRIRR